MKGLKELFFNPIILFSIAAVVVIALGSGVYYYVATRAPQGSLAVTASSTPAAVTGTGTVEPAENPNLAFESGGRVARVNVAVGQTVAQGQVLASLDTASLSAQRAQAEASLESQQAKLDSMKAGPRQVDVSAKQTAVAQASTALSNLYASLPATIASAYDKSFSGVSADTDTLFNQPNTPNATLAFSTTDSQGAQNAIAARGAVSVGLAAWKSETNALTSNSSPAAIDAELSSSIAHLQTLRMYADTLLEILGTAVPSGSFPQASIAAAQTSVGTLRDTFNTLILSLQGSQQQISTDELAVQSAQDALNQLLAGSTPQDIASEQATVDAAAANVRNFDAQIQNALVTAPFSGTVASVQVKQGDIVSPNTVAVSLNPKSALQVTAYFSEIDATKIKTGQKASVTLDAYGSGRVFPAQVVSVDTSPTAAEGYQATLQFAQADPAISSGMTANVSIPLNQ
ncbi:MAG: HlyD family efflux transporter periplasmic adaptor subunit [Patescibacteria group bacterium]|nr:HlyD family efflux transporter periplasmic adaptor subunit [Patescibacteria group bacterium]